MITVEHYSNGNIKGVFVTNDKGEWYNSNGPAVQTWFKNGQESYRAYSVDGKGHNPNGPAVQMWNYNGQERYRCYCVNGKYHNPDGPARQSWFENGKESYRAYWVDGKSLAEKEFLDLQNTVEVTVEGKTTRISRESAKALNLIKG